MGDIRKMNLADKCCNTQHLSAKSKLKMYTNPVENQFPQISISYLKTVVLTTVICTVTHNQLTSARITHVQVQECNHSWLKHSFRHQFTDNQIASKLNLWALHTTVQLVSSLQLASNHTYIKPLTLMFEGFMRNLFHVFALMCLKRSHLPSFL